MIYNDDIANKALKNGDEKAFTYIYNKYFPQLCFYAEKIIRSMETAKDIVQDLFTKLWENREKTDITTSLKAYLYGSVYNTCLTHLTHIKIVRNHIEYDLTLENCDNRQQTTDSNNPLSILILKEIENKIEKGIESLPARCKDVFLLWERGLSYEEIAEELCVSIGTLHTQIKRAKTKLRKSLKNI